MEKGAGPLRCCRELEELKREHDDLRYENQALRAAKAKAEALHQRAQEALDELVLSAHHDALTETPNRVVMLDRVETAIAQARRRNAGIGLIFIDLDHFKPINDTLGHAAGDEVLQTVARRLKSVVRDADTVSRHGGDEFLVLLSEVKEPEDAAMVAEKILGALALPCRIGENVLQLSASLGITLYPADGEDAQTLIAHADAAMYVSKRRGGGNYKLYSEERGAEPAGHQAGLDAMTPFFNPPAPRDLQEAHAQLKAALQDAREREEQYREGLRQQTRFVAMVAHELRNPLAPIRTAAELLNAAEPSAASLARLQGIITRQVGHMTRLVDDLLDQSRIRTGRFQLSKTLVDVGAVLAAAGETCRSLIESRSQHLKVELPAKPCGVHGDQVRLTQIFSNLLRNASKYTQPGGSITLRAHCNAQSVIISVTDNSNVEEAEDLRERFNIYVHTPRAGGEAEAPGVGLAVVRELVEAHGGSVVAGSAGQGPGSEFIVTLPMVAAMPAQAAA